jgi:hypothetical protein
MHASTGFRRTHSHLAAACVQCVCVVCSVQVDALQVDTGPWLRYVRAHSNNVHAEVCA